MGLVKEVFRFALDLLLRRLSLFSFMNAIFFCSMLIAALTTGKTTYIGPRVGIAENLAEDENTAVTFVSIFLSNLAVSVFLLFTLAGLLFFPFPAGSLAVRAVLWGFMLNQLSTPMFLATFPTLLLRAKATS